MILSVHAIFGAAVASLVPTHPVLGFTLGFASHLAIDAIPHRDYELTSVEKSINKSTATISTVRNNFKLLRDMFVVSLDAVAGICLSYLFFFDPTYPFIFLLGAIGSLIPDFLTFVYLIIKHKPFVIFYNFHSSFVHSKLVLKLSQVGGVFLQFCTVSVLIAIIFGVRYFLSV